LYKLNFVQHNSEKDTRLTGGLFPGSVRRIWRQMVRSRRLTFRAWIALPEL